MNLDPSGSEGVETTQSVLGAFPSLTRVRAVVKELKAAGFPTEEISVVLGRPYSAVEQISAPLLPAQFAGLATAAAIGAMAALLFSSSFPLIRKLDSIPLAGPALRVLLILAVGASGGILLGPRVNDFVEDWQSSRQRRGREWPLETAAITVGATGRGEQVERAREILSRFGAEDLRIYGGSYSEVQ